jgi:hypothetical protein
VLRGRHRSVERSEIADVRDGAERYVGRVGPDLVVHHAGQREAVVLATLAVAQDRILPAGVVRNDEGAVAKLQLHGLEQMIPARDLRLRAEQALVARGACGRADLIRDGVPITKRSAAPSIESTIMSCDVSA